MRSIEKYFSFQYIKTLFWKQSEAIDDWQRRLLFLLGGAERPSLFLLKYFFFLRPGGDGPGAVRVRALRPPAHRHHSQDPRGGPGLEGGRGARHEEVKEIIIYRTCSPKIPSIKILFFLQPPRGDCWRTRTHRRKGTFFIFCCGGKHH